MTNILKKSNQIICDTLKKASLLLKISLSGFKIIYEPLGNRFNTIDNAMEVDTENKKIYVNQDWAIDRMQSYPIDLFFMPAHEVRHIYQRQQIDNLTHTGSCDEHKALVESWRANLYNYHRNDSSATFKDYICQPVEVDANAFANFFILKNNLGPARMSEESDELETARLKEIAKRFGIIIS